MTYNDFIDQVHRNVREESAWPDSGSAGQEQVDLAYIAGLAVISDVPLQRLDIIDSALGGTPLNGTVNKYALPLDIIPERDDLGFSHVEVDGYTFMPHQFVPPESVLHSGENTFQSDRVFVAFNPSDKALLITANPAVITYFGALKPVKPALVDTGTTDYPLDGLEGQRAVQIVSMHINGVTIRDSAAAQFNALLEKQYSGAQNG